MAQDVETTLTQCRLVRNGERQTLWIPTKYAQPGRRVGLREKTVQGGAYWDEGWKVDAVFNTMPAVYVLERGQDYKNTRRASDI